MKQNRPLQLLSLSAILFAIVACALPGRATRSAPDANSSIIETAIAGTFQAASQQTVAAALPTDTPDGPTGTLIETIPDGRTKYTDYDAGFEVSFPVGWLVVRPNSDEFNAALESQGAANSMLHDQMVGDQSAADDYRLLGYILHPEIKKDVIFGFSKTTWDPEDSKMLDNTNMGELVRGLESQTTLPGFRVEVAQIHDELNTRVIEVAGDWTLTDGTGDPVPFHSVFLYFKPVWTSTVRLSITFVQDYKDEFALDVKSIMASIKPTNP
jgi:hypothetical protein